MVVRVGLWVCVAGLLASACSDSGGDGVETGDEISEEAAAAFAGVYRMTSWTENEAGCDVPGEDLLASAMESQLVVGSTEIFGQLVVMVVSCTDDADCEAKAAAIDGGDLISGRLSVTMSEQFAADDLRGFTAWTGSEKDGVCTGREFDSHVLTLVGDELTLSTEVLSLEDRPPDSEGFCVVEGRAAQREAQDAPCVAVAKVVAERE